MSEENFDERETPQEDRPRVGCGVRWQTPEYAYVRKPSEWYWKIGIVSVGVTAAAFVLGNLLFGILTILTAFSLALFGAKKPDMLDMDVSSKGVRVNNKRYPYSELEHFWISEVGATPKLLLVSTGMLHTHIILPLGDVDPEEIREELLLYIDEEEIAEPMTERIIDRTGF